VPLSVSRRVDRCCKICHRTVAYRPGSLSEVLTEHYRRAHPEALGIPFSVGGCKLAAPHHGYRHRRGLPQAVLREGGG
jgi:hypothetical protein